MSLPLNVRHHQQDDSVSCGRACAQMVIGFESARLGVAKGTALPDQTTTMANAEANVLGNRWATEPSELAAHINRGLQTVPNSKRWMAVERKPSPNVTGDAANVEVASSLFNVVIQKLNAGFPSVLMIDDNDHWETAYHHAPGELQDNFGAIIPSLLTLVILSLRRRI
jgi:hypothetical protein